MLKITHILYMVHERFSSLGLGWCVSLVRQESDGSSIINLCLESKRVISKKSKKERELKFSRLCDSCHGSSETSKTNIIWKDIIPTF